MARAEQQQDGSVKVVDGPPVIPALNLAIQQMIAAGGRVWGDARGLNVADANGDIVGIFGDLSGLEWNGQPIPAGRTGILALDGYFSGILAANTVHYENLVVAFAKVDQVKGPGNPVIPSIEHVAADQDDWNVIKLTNAFPTSGTDPILVYTLNIIHEGTPLSTLVGSYYVQLSADGVEWTEPQHLPFISGITVATILPDDTEVIFGHILYSYRLVGFVYGKLEGDADDLWIRFKRHAIGE